MHYVEMHVIANAGETGGPCISKDTYFCTYFCAKKARPGVALNMTRMNVRDAHIVEFTKRVNGSYRLNV